MISSESLSFLRVIGDEDYSSERDGERRCLRKHPHDIQNNGKNHIKLINNILLLRKCAGWSVRCPGRLGYGVCYLIMSLLALVSICFISFLLLNAYNSTKHFDSINDNNNNNLKHKQTINSNNFLDDSDDDQPLSPFEEAVMVDTNCGKVIGTVEDGAFAFKGIGYALPPTGTRRWSRPIPMWSDGQECHKRQSQHKRVKHFGSQCVQYNPLNKLIEGNEDCLYLNIWTPRLDDSSNLEVMVWFHGGLLQYGSGHVKHLRPNGKLSRDSNFVFVSFNYRLQAMGFLALDLLANSGANSSFGNYGLWDSMVVLEWIQRNIHSFGGDPRRVTLFGSDGGAAMIMALMTNPDSRALFRSVWLTDPALYFNRTFSEASTYNHQNFLTRTDCQDINCLYKLTPDRVLRAFIGDDDPSYVIKDQNDLPIQGMLNKQLIVIDDELVTAAMPFPADTVVDIPVLIGSTAQAVEYWPGPKDISKWTWSDYNKYVTTSLDSFGQRLTQLALQQYPPSPTQSPAQQYLTMVTDLRQTCPVNLIAANLSSLLVSPIYRYLITSQPSQPIQLFDFKSQHSLHLWDLIAFFGTIDRFIKTPTEDDQQFSGQLRDIVFNFVRDGKPDSIIPLPAKWDQSFPHQMALIDSNDTQILNNYVISDRCEFWDGQGLTKYAWVS